MSSLSSKNIQKQSRSFIVFPARPSANAQEGAGLGAVPPQNVQAGQRNAVNLRAPPRNKRDCSFSYDTVPSKVIPWSTHRASNAQPSKHHKMIEYGKSESPTESPHSADGGDILDYGMSVEVLEDTRRAVILEIKDIKKENKMINANVKQEEQKEKQYKKDLGYSQREIDSLCKGIDVEHEKAKTHRSFVNKLEADYKLQVALPLQQSRLPLGATDTTSFQPVTPESRTVEGKSLSDRPGTKGSTFMEKRAKMVKDLFQKLRTYERIISKGTSDIKEAHNMHRIVLRIIREHGLEELIAKTESEVNQLRQDYNEGDKRRQKLYEIIGDSKDRIAGFKRETASKRKHLKTIQKEHAEWQSSKTDEISIHRSNTVTIEAKKVALLSKIEQVQAQIKELQSLKAGYESFNNRKVAHKSRMEGLVAKRSVVESSKADLMKKIEDAKKIQAKAEQRQYDAKVALDASKKLKVSSEVQEGAAVNFASKELLKIAQQKETLCTHIEEYKKELESSRKKDAARIADSEKKNEGLAAAVAEAEAVLQPMKSSMLEAEASEIQARESLEEKIMETDKRCDKMQGLVAELTKSRTAAFRLAVLKEAPKAIELSHEGAEETCEE